MDVVNHRAMQQKTHLIEIKHTRPPPGLEFQHDCDQTFFYRISLCEGTTLCNFNGNRVFYSNWVKLCRNLGLCM